MMNEELKLRDIAGFCPEEAVWKMLADICGLLLREDASYALTPDSIVIDGDTFMVKTGNDISQEFVAPDQDKENVPETAQMVWSLGAVAYDMATGHVIFGGRGGDYQKEHPSVPLPVLNSVVHRCLCHNPQERISLQELKTLATNGRENCLRQRQEEAKMPEQPNNQTAKQLIDNWPEEMIEI